jgi:hypothetical protein
MQRSVPSSSHAQALSATYRSKYTHAPTSWLLPPLASAAAGLLQLLRLPALLAFACKLHQGVTLPGQTFISEMLCSSYGSYWPGPHTRKLLDRRSSCHKPRHANCIRSSVHSVCSMSTSRKTYIRCRATALHDPCRTGSRQTPAGCPALQYKVSGRAVSACRLVAALPRRYGGLECTRW